MTTKLHKTFCPAAALGGWMVSQRFENHFCSCHQFTDNDNRDYSWNVGSLFVQTPDVAASQEEQ
jgi:hypothetical protein